MKYEKLNERQESIGRTIVHAAYLVHVQLGPGLLEKVYETCLAHEIQKAGLLVERQVDLPIEYDGITLGGGLRLDLLIEKSVIVEVKSVEIVNPIWQAQILSQLKLSRLRLGYLINFNVSRINYGIKRFIM